jgi:hypothetical protein
MTEGSESRPWKTLPITLLVFLPVWTYGFTSALSDAFVSSTGFDHWFVATFQGIGFAFIPTLIALGLCVMHNRSLKKSSR